MQCYDKITEICRFNPLSPVHTGNKVELKTVDFVESQLLAKPATNRQRSTLLPVRSTNQQQRKFDSLSRSALLLVCTEPKRLCRHSTKSTVLNSTLSPVWTGNKSATKSTVSATVDFVADLLPVSATVDFVASVHRASECKGNYSATSNNIKLVHWQLMGGLLHLVQRGGDWAGCSPRSVALRF